MFEDVFWPRHSTDMPSSRIVSIAGSAKTACRTRRNSVRDILSCRFIFIVQHCNGLSNAFRYIVMVLVGKLVWGFVRLIIGQLAISWHRRFKPAFGHDVKAQGLVEQVSGMVGVSRVMLDTGTANGIGISNHVEHGSKPVIYGWIWLHS